jgi:hypothetical protein
MSNTRKTRRPFTAAVARGGEHAGILSVHRFGTDGKWAAGSGADVQLVAELINTGESPAYFHCGDCDSITTGLRNRPDGPYDLIGITHSPGCPWLTAAPRQAR